MVVGLTLLFLAQGYDHGICQVVRDGDRVLADSCGDPFHTCENCFPGSGLKFGSGDCSDSTDCRGVALGGKCKWKPAGAPQATVVDGMADQATKYGEECVPAAAGLQGACTQPAMNTCVKDYWKCRCLGSAPLECKPPGDPPFRLDYKYTFSQAPCKAP
jgi:hypothetical protein